MERYGATNVLRRPVFGIIADVREIDDFLSRFVTRVLSERGFRKSSHTYRKRYESGDWSIFSFRGYPLPDVRGSFHVDASFVPKPMWDWFMATRPKLAKKQPTGQWIYWGTPLGPLAGLANRWEYQTDTERELTASLLADRLAEVSNLFDTFAEEPDLLLSQVLTSEPTPFPELPLFHHHLRHHVWRVALLARRGPSTQLNAAVAASDPYPALQLRHWVDDYLARSER